MDALGQRIDQFNTRIGQAVAWMCLLMVIVTFVIVILRYWFDIGWIWLQESVIWMHAAVFMLAAAFTLVRDEHVRVDIFYRKMSPHGQALVDALGTLFFLLPVTLFLIWSSWDYVSVSWEIKETSREAGGLAYPLPSLMKSFIPVMSVLLLLQAMAMLARSVVILRATRR
jgi:TRAP-type mannitol/chloroaromatic compound transport system permease small subunit